MSETYDAVVVGSGPNGLAAAIRLAGQGARVLVLEAAERPGGGMRTEPLTLPGYAHDRCAACHPMGVLSPWFRQLPLERHGLRWASSPISVAHPLDDLPAVVLGGSVDATAAGLGADGAAYRALLDPLVAQGPALFEDLLAPLGIPARPLGLSRFGRHAWRSAEGLARAWFREAPARALLAGCAGHAVQPLDNPFTAAITLVFLISAHLADWPVAVGGSEAIARALVAHLTELGGELRVGVRVRSLADLPPSRVVLFDTSPDQLATIAGSALPARYRRALDRYRYGPASYKLDWALDGPIPWSDERVCQAATVHVGGTLEEIAEAERAAWDGRHHPRPYVLVVQQSALDPSRAPAGKHTGYGYIHVPAGSEVDCTEAIEAQIERFAPGFRDRILARHVTRPVDFATYNPNFVGGAVTGGAADIRQLFTRPVARIDPYSTPNPALFLCSASTPPGGGVHGMCGYHAAGSALRALPGRDVTRWGAA